jgi:hypothetical protein
MESRQAGMTLYLNNYVSFVEETRTKIREDERLYYGICDHASGKGYFGGYSLSRIVLAKNNQKELYLSAKVAIFMEEKISR